MAKQLSVLTGGLPTEYFVAHKTLAHVLTHDNQCLANLIAADFCSFNLDGGQEHPPRTLSIKMLDVPALAGWYQ
jgi:hypothetical protein